MAKTSNNDQRWHHSRFMWLAIVGISLKVLVSNRISHYHAPTEQRALQEQTTTKYFVLLHLVLQQVDDDLAYELADPTSNAVQHFCEAVNNQVRN